MGSRLLPLQRKASLRFGEIGLVDFEPDKFFHAAALRANGRISDSKKWIKHRLHTRNAVQFDAPFGQFYWKRRRMRSLLRAALNCFVWNKPGVPTTTQVASACMPPACNVALVLIRNAEREPVDFDTTGLREMENVLMAVVQKPLGTDRLEMPVGLGTVLSILNGDRFDPVNCILQDKQGTEMHYDFMGQHRVRRSGADVEKKRSVRF